MAELLRVEDINVYVDMKDAVPGLQEFPLMVDQPASGMLVKYSLTEATYELNVLGETNADSDEPGTDSNNG